MGIWAFRIGFINAVFGVFYRNSVPTSMASKKFSPIKVSCLQKAFFQVEVMSHMNVVSAGCPEMNDI
jgi:hypothetical protein